MTAQRSLLGLLGVVLGLGACDFDRKVPDEERVGRLFGRLVLPDDREISDVAYRITQAGSSYDRSGEVPTDDASVLTFRVGSIPVGTGYTIEITATTDDAAACVGSSPFDILDREVTQAVVIIRCAARDEHGDLEVDVDVEVSCPLITAVTAIPAQVEVGSSLTLAVEVSHGQPPLLWSGAGGTFDDPTAAETTFTCTSRGVHDLTVRLDRPDCEDSQTIPIACTGPGGCGDAFHDPGEECDDGNDSDEDGCLNGCVLAMCGDSFVHQGVEPCDDGNDSNGDACLNDCTLAACGDGFVHQGVEPCDDGDDSNEDACLDDCTLAACGDGFVYEGVELCDDGNDSNHDACVNDCLPAQCGDGFVHTGEEACDDGNDANTDECLEDCELAVCGDGFVWAGHEDCDDDNGSNTDACLSSCEDASCGDGFVWAGQEVCDDANGSNTDACLASCVAASCGDGFVRAGVETCDDGNGTNGDGCTSACIPEPVQVVAGGQHVCARFAHGAVKCWGYNAFGQLGLGDTAYRGDAAGEMGAALPFVNLGTGRTAKSIAAGNNHSCALLDDDSVKCWGYNASGQLGLGNTTHRGDQAGEMGDSLASVSLGSGRTAKRISAGGDATCALLDDDSVKCWGSNGFGQLGLGNTANRGDGPSEMGNALPVIALGTDRTAKALVNGNAHACALLDDDSVKCWGANGSGQLGLGDTAHRGDAAGEMGDALPTVALGSSRTARRLVAGISHTCALLDDDSLKCWGSNTIGQLGQGDTTNRGDAAGEMGDALPVIALGTGRSVRAAIAGTSHTCALLDNFALKCWGQGFYGQLGQGNTTNRGDGPGEMGDALPAVSLGSGRSARQLAAGMQHGCALLDDGRLKCWGYNFYGQLGLGNTVNRGDNAGEMGDALPAITLW